MRLQILMSTYNGAKYLREQMDSILAQTVMYHSDWFVEIVIRDDGSTDETIKILEEYSVKYPRLSYYKGENEGVVRSFFDLICNTPDEVDYIALADQDDLWMPEKLECALMALSKEENSQPLLYCGSTYLVDDRLRPIKGLSSHAIRPSFGNALVENICTGCTAVFNAALRDIIKLQIPEFTPMHDWWLYLLSACLGKVYYDTEPHMYYRQHGSNTVGVSTTYRHEFINRLKRFRGNRYQIRRQVMSLYKISRRYNLSLGVEIQRQIEDVLAVKKNAAARLRVICNHKIYRQRPMDNFIFKLIILTGTL